ncbi:MAG: hypothetical protein PUB87_04850 [Eubacteriaceae bacterium]|nr:hypothetical protein [Eubacteriaceae bacterium]
MNVKMIVFAALSFIFLFSAGVFTEIFLPSEGFNTNIISDSLTYDLMCYLKEDFILVTAMMIAGFSVIMFPLTIIIAGSKIFSLGFSTAFLLTRLKSNAFLVITAVLLPRNLLKLPLYALLILISFDTSKEMKKTCFSPPAVKKVVPRLISRYLICLGLLTIPSILEVVLLHIILSQ